MKLGSLFDGSGGFPLAGSLCGIEPKWAAEIEPYPIAVTRSRFPSMRHLGDISKVSGAEIEPVDIITFGSPCQDLSVAGKRAGLKHEANGDDETTRSGLFMEAVRIIKEMREATNGECPTFALWENVPGAFSSNKGEDFRTVLEELVRIVEPNASVPPVPKAGWAYADSFCGDGWSLAYRVFDAQYWGVPQRRRRIHLVLDLRGERAREVLFEREGVRGYFTQGRTPWQGATSNVKKCFVIDSIGGQAERGWQTSVGPCLKATHYKSPPAILAAGFCTEHSAKARGIGYQEEVAPTLRAGVTPAVVAKGPSGVAYGVDCRNMTETPELYQTLQAKPNGGQSLNFSDTVHVCDIVRRLTPTECARLQGFADCWGDIDPKDGFTEEEYQFWLEVRNNHAAISGKAVKEYTMPQMLTWYNKLHTDSSEYKMWGNGIALPPALYCMQGMETLLRKKVSV